MDKFLRVLAVAVLTVCSLLEATCPSIGRKRVLGAGYNAHVGIDSSGNGVFVCQTTPEIRSTVIRTWHYSASSNSYAGPIIISNEYTDSTQLTFAHSLVLSTAVAAWTEDDHVVARSKPALLYQDNWLAITQVSGMNADQPDVAMNSLGQAFLVWRRVDEYGNRLVELSTKSSATASWTNPILLTSDPTIELPRVSANSLGDIFVIWLQEGQLWGMRKPAASSWEAPLQLSFGYTKPESHRALVGRKGGNISYFSQDEIGISSFHVTTTQFTGWVLGAHVGHGSAFHVNLAQSTGTGTIFGVKGLGPINANTALEAFEGWSSKQTLLNTNDQGAEAAVDANDLGRSWAAWGSLDLLSGPQVRFFDGTAYCPLKQIDNGVAGGSKVAMNNQEYQDAALPTRPQAHFLWLAIHEELAG